MKFEQDLLDVLKEDRAHDYRSVIMAKDYELDAKFDPDEINHKLSTMQPESQKDIDYIALFPAQSVDSNYRRLLTYKLDEYRDLYFNAYWR